MSAVTFDWTSAPSRQPVTWPLHGRRVHSREAEFCSALDTYVAGYVAEQRKRAAAATGSPGPRRT